MNASEPIKRNFSDWSLQSLRDTFKLQLNRQHATLKAWEEAAQNEELDPPLQQNLESLRDTVERHAGGWNEEELKLHFLGPLFRFVDFDGEDYGAFAGRSFGANVGGYHLSGIVDGVVARGYWEPVLPYFCLQEFKPEKGRDKDPAGQCLSAMLAARELNADGEPLYGAYILGRFWFFLTLDGEKMVYGLSKAYDSSSEDLEAIFRLLRTLKRIVAGRVETLAKMAP